MTLPSAVPGRTFFTLTQKTIIGSSGFIHGAHGGHGIFIHGAHGGHGIFWELLRKKSWRKSLIKIWPVARNHYGSTEHTEDTDILSTEGTLSNHRNLNGCFFWIIRKN